MSKIRQTYYTHAGKGVEPEDILMQLYNDTGFRMVVLNKETLSPRNIADALNSAYERGRKEAMEDLRRLVGAKGVDDRW